jgi:uncharacterized protein YyaL (SSP411 family)
VALDYLAREMTSPEGAFYSATDADSEGPDGVSAEGKFFVWSKREIEQLTGGAAARFCAHYGVSAGGNFEGENILHVARPDENEWAALADARAALYAVSTRRRSIAGGSTRRSPSRTTPNAGSPIQPVAGS